MSCHIFFFFAILFLTVKICKFQNKKKFLFVMFKSEIMKFVVLGCSQDNG